MFKKYATSVVEFLLWVAVIATIIYIVFISEDPLSVSLGAVAALCLAGYWTMRTVRAEREASEEQRKLEKETREVRVQKERLETLFELTHDGVIVLDEEQRILDINDAITAMTGFTKAEVIGHACGSIFRCEKYHEAGLSFGLAFLTEHNPTYYEEVATYTKDGRPLEVGVRSTRSKKISGHKSAGLLLIRDLTKIHEAERLEHDFVSMTSHQLFTPLSIIRGNISLMLDGDLGKITPKQHNFLEQSLQSAKRMVHLITELLSISRLEERKITLNFTPTVLSHVIPEIMEEMKPLAERKHVHLKHEKPTGKVPSVAMDTEKIRQVLQNLIDNAIKYTSSDGTVTVSTEVRPQDVVISVKDTGIGIPTGDQSKLFQRFFRSANVLSIDSKGTGLGLYIARVIVERHHGKIWAESKEGHGSTFYVSLPR